MNAQTFHLSVVLSAYHNKLLCTFAELRSFLNYMTGHQVALWDIPKARALVAKSLARQHPWLPAIEPPPGFKVDGGNAGRFIRQVAKHTDTYTVPVKPLGRNAFQPTTGVAAMTKMRVKR